MQGVPVLTPSTDPTILLIEDNEFAREGLMAILRRENYQVTATTNGRQALDYLQAGNRSDLILLDMLMPVLDGWKFLEEVRNWSKPLKVPIIVTTGTILTPEWATQNGCAGLVRKPIDTDELLDEVKRCIAAWPDRQG